MSLEDIHKWNVTSVDTVTALLRASRGRRLDAQVTAGQGLCVWHCGGPVVRLCRAGAVGCASGTVSGTTVASLLQVAALIFRYMMGRNWLDQEVLDALAGFRPLYLCVLSPEQLVHLPPSAVESVGPQDLDTCSPQQLAVLYPKALLAFRNASGPGYTEKIQSFLGEGLCPTLQGAGGSLCWR